MEIDKVRLGVLTFDGCTSRPAHSQIVTKLHRPFPTNFAVLVVAPRARSAVSVGYVRVG
jgi:hypothetical protein